ncbi:hypothetical protein [Paucibacter sp. M5-1]|uniref:hypothetical protein n=1 Tax=Paucibacter sp. M5-1 TaxID=3015998 RepID=UPI0022B8D1AD|nr:hypothetical protein [Paucibacter sp. M5-1]MCZ7881804.1 hypothetical protein [Paucibacter sp. M5-1]
MGGTLNPIFSLLAFLGILFTIILQARQVQHAQEQTEVLRHQSGLEEMQRVMSSVAIRVDSLLAEPIQLPEDKFRLLVKRPRSMFELISALGTLKVNDGRERDPLAPDWEQWHWTDKAAALTEELGTLTVPLRLELEALAWMLNRYKAAEGNQTVQGFYSYRYFAVVVWLDALGLISNHGQLQMFFEPASKRDFMKA